MNDTELFDYSFDIEPILILKYKDISIKVFKHWISGYDMIIKTPEFNEYISMLNEDTIINKARRKFNHFLKEMYNI